MIGATYVPVRGSTYIPVFQLDTILEQHGELLDLAAVERAVNGQPIALTAAEQYEAARQLGRRGFPLRVIEERTGLLPRLVSRWAARDWPEPTPAAASARARQSGNRKGGTT